MFVSKDYSSLNGGGISTLTISNPYDKTLNIDAYTGTAKFKLSFCLELLITPNTVVCNEVLVGL